MKTFVMATLALAGLAASVNAGVLLTPGNVVVYRVGNLSNVLSSAGTAVFVDEYTPAGTLVQSIPMPTTGANAFVASGTATSEGLLTVSADGRYIAITGYNANLGTTAITGTSATAAPRTVAVIDVTNGATTYTRFSDAFSANNIRSAVTDGTSVWATGANSGVRYTTLGATGTSTQLSTTTTNLRQVNIFNGQLYISSSSGTTRVATVGTGTPTTTGNTITNLAGAPSTVASPYAFSFVDLSPSVPGVDTLYVADDGAGGGIEKFSLVGSSWVANGVVGAAADAYRGITASVNAGVVTLFATRGGGTNANGGGQLVSLTDASGYNAALTGTPTLLASAVTSTTTGSFNTSFRGVGYIPVPTPGSLALLGVGGLIATRRRR
ncbi:MAG: hypothetical protein WC718_04175 [Phycisphaerales bacterium]|jgi:hypothetical protein